MVKKILIVEDNRDISRLLSDYLKEHGYETICAYDGKDARVKIKEQGYNPTLSLLRLSKKYSESRLESACKLALVQIRSPRYHHLNAILAANQDILAEQLQNKPKQNNTQGYIRGSAYDGGNEND